MKKVELPSKASQLTTAHEPRAFSSAKRGDCKAMNVISTDNCSSPYIDLHIKERAAYCPQ